MKKYYFHQTILFSSVALMLLSVNISCGTRAANNEGSNVIIPKELVVPALMERKGQLAKADEWLKTKEKVAGLTQKINQQMGDTKSRLQLAVIYMSEARITGEHPYYYPAILSILDGVLSLDQKNFEALVYKAAVKLSQHRFLEAREVAEKALTINPDNAYVYGVLVDANVELGNYGEAVKMSDKMQALKPSLESYSRASYLREIYGDYNGAIDAMKMAVQAGVPGSEPWCWSKKTIGQLYEKNFRWKEASQEYETILAARPSYAFAMEGMARVEKAAKNYPRALEWLTKASAIMPEFSFNEAMAEVYILQGQKEKAAEEFENVLSMLKEDEASGHSVALEMCRIYTTTGQYRLAIEAAKKEYNERPENIDVNQALAWAYFKNNDRQLALEHIDKALKTGSKDPELLERANLIKKGG
jgi:tetratricopeptide (TPR) repeat protein